MSDSKNTETSPTTFDLYKIALDTRNFEIDLFWKRSNYFLVLNTAIAVGFFSLLANSNDVKHSEWLGTGIAVFGLVVSFLWFKVTLGSKFWQEHWERRLHEKEEELNEENKKRKICLFSTSKADVHKCVYDGLMRNSQLSCTDLWVLKKPSVSRNMMALSISFVVIWVLLLLYSLYGLYKLLC